MPLYTFFKACVHSRLGCLYTNACAAVSAILPSSTCPPCRICTEVVHRTGFLPESASSPSSEADAAAPVLSAASFHDSVDFFPSYVACLSSDLYDACRTVPEADKMDKGHETIEANFTKFMLLQMGLIYTF